MPSLNQVMTPEREGGDQTQCLTFQLGEEMFAVPILNVREIIEHGHITVVPMMPDAIRGVINLRGAVVPVVDLNRRFGRGHTKEGKRTCIVIVEIPRDTETLVVGMIPRPANAPQSRPSWACRQVFDEGNRAAEHGTRLVVVITLIMMVVEILAGWWFNSMALLADGWHMSSHAVAIGLSALAYTMS